MNNSRSHVRPYFNPTDEHQREAALAFRSSDVLFLLGRAGSGKTHAAVALALNEYVEHRANEIWLCRPTVECGEELGFIPGDLDEKLAPWFGPINDVLPNLTFTKFPDLPFRATALQYMRGRTISNAVAILDEAQNCTREQLRMFLTRIGRAGRVIVTGDPTQRDTRQEALLWTVERLRGLPGVGVVQMKGQHRLGIVSQIDERLR